VQVALTTEAAALDVFRQTEHVVPVRVLVDRILMEPRDIEGLFPECVVLAHVTRDEHRQLGPLWRDHPELYEAMLSAPPQELVEIGLRRYTKRSLTLRSRARADAVAGRRHD